MAKIDLDGDGKADISISLPQIITILAMFASIVGSYYTLGSRIEAVENIPGLIKEKQKKKLNL
jgi:hypothetical protein